MKKLSVIVFGDSNSVDFRNTILSASLFQKNLIEVLAVDLSKQPVRNLNCNESSLNSDYVYEKIPLIALEQTNYKRISDFWELLFNSCTSEHILFIDETILLNAPLVSTIIDVVRHRPHVEILPIPVRLNLNQRGAHVPFATTGEPLFEYGVVKKTILNDLAKSLPNFNYEDFLNLSFFLSASGGAADLFQKKNGSHLDKCLSPTSDNHYVSGRNQSLQESQWKSKNGVNKGDRTHFLVFTDTRQDKILSILIEISTTLTKAYLTILQTGNCHYLQIKDKMIGLIERYDANMLKLLIQMDYKRSLIHFLASYDHYLDLFDTRLGLMDFLIFYYYEDIMEGNIIGDREFLDNFINVTQNNSRFMQKLLKAKV